MIFTSITNPFYQVTTDAIEILISDSGQRLVCQTESGTGPKVTTTTGTMAITSLTSIETTEIN